jgi:hypothetical protein
MAWQCTGLRIRAPRFGVQDHHHSDLPEDGKAYEHVHECEFCTNEFKHTHKRRPYEESVKYPHLCRECRDEGRSPVTKPVETPVVPTPELTEVETEAPAEEEGEEQQPEPESGDPIIPAEETPAPLQDHDLEARLLSFLRIQASGLKRDINVFVALRARGYNWLKDHGIEDEREQEDLLKRVMDQVMVLTPIDQGLRSAAVSSSWRSSNILARQLGRGQLHTFGWWQERAIETSCALLGATAGAWLGYKAWQRVCEGTWYTPSVSRPVGPIVPESNRSWFRRRLAEKLPKLARSVIGDAGRSNSELLDDVRNLSSNYSSRMHFYRATAGTVLYSAPTRFGLPAAGGLVGGYLGLRAGRYITSQTRVDLTKD